MNIAFERRRLKQRKRDNELHIDVKGFKALKIDSALEFFNMAKGVKDIFTFKPYKSLKHLGRDLLQLGYGFLHIFIGLSFLFLLTPIFFVAECFMSLGKLFLMVPEVLLMNSVQRLVGALASFL